jgi:hypothetical protein
MALRWLSDMDIETNSGLTSEEVGERKCLLESAATKSIWTVDLVRLLENILKEQDDNPRRTNHSNTSYLFCSEVHGVNYSHSTTGYYAKAFENDSVRVSKIFDEIERQQLPMLCPFHLNFGEVLEVTSFENCIAIVLVDNYVLMHPLVHELDQNSKGEDGETLSTADQNTDTYAGHYVILCGKSFDSGHIKKALAWESKTYNSERDSYCLVLSNPGIPDQTMFVTPQLLERAWRAEGTDCDIIFIAKHRES